MRLIRSISALSGAGRRHGRVVTIGAFDGLHLGHQEIFRTARGVAFEGGQIITALSFEPTPAEYFARDEPPSRLTCFRERYELLAAIGVDELVCPHFRTVSSFDHRRFVDEVLVQGLGVSQVVIGHDFRYGAARKGDIESLAAAADAGGFGLVVVEPVFVNGERVSSTRVRESLESGALDSARMMLGRDYSMSGRVVHGRGLGRDLGFPTANVNLKRRRSPVDGIFAVQVDGIGDAPIDGVASVGRRPTVGGGEALLEVYLFDFDADLYGEYITVRFRKRLRAEQHFDTIEAMQVQMQADVEAAKAALDG